MVGFLERKLGNDFVVVGAPDHPFLLRPADVIIGGRSSLTAVMTPTVHEIRRPDFFEARLTLNMMALPPNTKFVFVGQEQLAISSDGVFETELNMDDRDWKEDLLSISQQPNTYRQVDRARKLQRACESRFADTYRLAKALQKRSRKETEVKTTSRVSSPARDRIYPDVEAAFFNGVAAPGAIAKLTLEDVNRWFQYHDGEPGPTDRPASVIYASGYPKRPGDPRKLVRAAAFAGWVISPPTDLSSDELGELILKYTRSN